jgi:phage terminase small subunit
MTNMQQRTQATVRPGGRVRISGQYRAESFDGTVVTGSETTLTKGSTAPPTTEKGMVWALVDRTHHKNDPPPEQESDDADDHRDGG